ncbi:hypothetical protein [Pseudohaliea rubra]|uniref:Transmembrane protein n=1 Tax=Pseudohaliea rubra DSM 19751 TaxID=1265313 RepID=A0A095XTL3_9GAMM|nr:hypothetical protein [Pseudohaliea rubra]KGE02996.1 hypothetical protein HRUBRA_02434 [Pseudohaliea rubra DSM 19751]
MSTSEVIALAGFAAAAFAMLLVTQTKDRVAWPAWLVPLAVALPLAAWGGVAIYREELSGFWPLLTGSAWGLHAWFDRLMLLAAGFFLLQNRARAAGMKSEVWVIAVMFTGAVGLLLMLARTVYLERQPPR